MGSTNKVPMPDPEYAATLSRSTMLIITAVSKVVCPKCGAALHQTCHGRATHDERLALAALLVD